VTATPAAAVYEPRSVKRQRRTNAQITAVQDAIVEAVGADHPVTLRGVYYRVVSAGAVPKTEAAYQLVGRELLKLRRNGTVPYSWITDGTRLHLKSASFSGLDHLLDSAAKSYRRALWDDQNDAVIVLSEKDAISGVVYPVTDRWDVELGIVRGYSSETFTHSIAETVLANRRRGKVTWIYQLGDHDPSGLDAWRSFQQRVTEFVQSRAVVLFERLAVTPRQIEDYRLPTRPTKRTDTRAAGFAGESVEVDALPATVLRSIVEDAIVWHIDQEALRLTRIAEKSERAVLRRIKGLAS
jgi:hypothetical protein